VSEPLLQAFGNQAKLQLPGVFGYVLVTVEVEGDGALAVHLDDTERQAVEHDHEDGEESSSCPCCGDLDRLALGDRDMKLRAAAGLRWVAEQLECESRNERADRVFRELATVVPGGGR
jgi:hypothetical protein